MNKEQRLQVYNKYNGHCAYCGNEIEYSEMQVDHILPMYIYKGKLSIEEFRGEIKLQAERAMQTFSNRMLLTYGLIDYYPQKEIEFYYENYERDRLGAAQV